MKKIYSTLLAGLALTLASPYASANKLDDGTYTLPGIYEVGLFNYDSDASPRQVTVKATVTYDATEQKYVLKEVNTGNGVLPYYVQFDFDEAANTATFSQYEADALTKTSFSAFTYDWGETTLVDGYEVKFDPQTGTLEVPAEDFGFSWLPTETLGWSYPSFSAQFEVNSFQQVEDVDNENPGGEGWIDLGNATLMDGWILPLLGINQYENQYEVLMQQNVENENLYRLVNPYKTGPAAIYNGHRTKEGYIEFDVTDPEKVKFSYVYAGFSNQHPDLGEFEDIYCIDMWSWMSKKFESNEALLNSFWKSYGYSNSTYDAEKGEINMLGNGKSGYDLSYAACVGLPSQIRQEGDVAGGTNWQDPKDGHFLDMTTKIIFPKTQIEEPVCPAEIFVYATTADGTFNVNGYTTVYEGDGQYVTRHVPVYATQDSEKGLITYSASAEWANVNERRFGPEVDATEFESYTEQPFVDGAQTSWSLVPGFYFVNFDWDQQVVSMDIETLNYDFGFQVKANETDNRASDILVPVTVSNIPTGVEVDLYYRLNGSEDDFQLADRVIDDVETTAVEGTTTSNTNHTFTLRNLENGQKLRVDVYAVAGPDKSEVKTLEMDALTGVNGITVDGDDNAVYYNLQGIRIERPISGTVIIRVNGDKAVKELVK